MLQIARTLGNSRKINRIFSSSKELDNLFIENYWIENISREKVEFLKNSGLSLEEIVCTDLVDSEVGVLVNSSDRLETIAHNYLKLKEKEDKKRFYSPVKLMASLTYLTMLKTSEAKDMLPEAENSDDYKKILFFDLVYARLDDERKIKVDNIENWREKCEKSAFHYIFQNVSKKIEGINTQLRRIKDEISSSSELNTSAIKSYSEIKTNIPPYINFDFDSDAHKKLVERSHLIEDIGFLIEDKTKDKIKKYESDFLISKEYFRSITEIPKRENISNLENQVVSLRHEFTNIKKINPDFNHEETESFFSDVKRLSTDYSTYINNFEEMHEKINKISQLKSEFNMNARQGSYKKCIEILSIIKPKTGFESNPFLQKLTSELNYSYRQFSSSAYGALREKEKSVALKLEEREKKYTETKGLKRLFLKSFITPEIKILQDDLEEIRKLKFTLTL